MVHNILTKRHAKIVLIMLNVKKHQQQSDRIRTHEFIQQVQNIIDESSEDNEVNCKTSEATIRRTVYENLRYKSDVMSGNTKENHLVRSKQYHLELKQYHMIQETFNKLKPSAEQKNALFF